MCRSFGSLNASGTAVGAPGTAFGGSRNDVWGTRNGGGGTRNGVWGTRNGVWGTRNDVWGTRNDGGGTRRTAFGVSASFLEHPERRWGHLERRLGHPGPFSGVFLMPLGVENRGKITQNRSKGRSGSEKGKFFCKNAEVQQTRCFASPNGSPQEPKFEISAEFFRHFLNSQRFSEK